MFEMMWNLFSTFQADCYYFAIFIFSYKQVGNKWQILKRNEETSAEYGELQFEARDGYSNRLMLKDREKVPFDVKMVSCLLPSGEQHFYSKKCCKQEVSDNDISKLMFDLWHLCLMLLKTSKAAETGFWLSCTWRSAFGDSSGKTHV